MARCHSRQVSLACLFSLLATALVVPGAARAQHHGDPAEAGPVIAVVEAALQAISDEDMVALTDLMIEGAVAWSVTPSGVVRVTRLEEREKVIEHDLLERGFDPQVQIAGGVATAWVPYDFHLNGAWSHCGVDVFTMVQVDGAWRIASMAWSVEQPPACRPHPDGPPGG